MKIYFIKGNPLFPLVKFYCLCLNKHTRTPWVLQRLLQSQCTEPLPQTSNAIQGICPRTLLSHKNDTSWRKVYFISCNKIKRDKFTYTSKSQNLRFKGKKNCLKFLFVSASWRKPGFPNKVVLQVNYALQLKRNANWSQFV